jgi:hypothetical protein
MRDNIAAIGQFRRAPPPGGRAAPFAAFVPFVPLNGGGP